MMEYKVFLSAAGITLVILGYSFYYRCLFLRTTKPHAFSWFIWTLTMGIGFAAQVSEDAGPGSWILLAETLFSSSIFLFALFIGEKGYRASDWIALGLGLLSLAAWKITGSPFLSVVLITLVDTIAFYPTVRKSIRKPYEESMFLYVCSIGKYALLFFALDVFSFITAFYPACLAAMNVAFVGMLVWRRRRI
jgi:hypothetical protein